MPEFEEPDKPLATPAYIAAQRRDGAIRAAKERCQGKIADAYRQLEIEERAARETWLSDLQDRMDTVCAMASDRRAA